MKITFCLPKTSNRPVGGFKVVFEYANLLVEKGHDVNLIFFTNNSFNKFTKNKQIKQIIGKLLNSYRPNWFVLDRRIKKIATVYTDGREMPDADVVFATAVETAEVVKKLPLEKGKPFYLIQDFEDWNVSKDYVISTYKMGMVNITVSEWLKDIVLEYDRNVYLLKNAINTNVFNVTVPIENRNKFNLILLHHEGNHKGVSDAIQAIKLVKANYPEIRLQLFGTFDKPTYFDATWMSYKKNVTPEELSKLMNNAAIMICASINEGFGLTGAEAMASGCALVSTSYPGVKEYAVDRLNSLLSPVRDTVKLAQNIELLLENDELRFQLARTGSEMLKKLSWAENVYKLEKILNENLKE